MTTATIPEVRYLRAADDHIFHSEGRVYHVTPEHPFHKAIQRLAEQGEFASAIKLCDPRETIRQAASAVLIDSGVATLLLSAVEPPKPEAPPVTTLFNGAVQTQGLIREEVVSIQVNSDGVVTINGKNPDPLFSKVIFDRLMAERPFDDLILFYLRLSRNPHASVIKDRLFKFLQFGNYPILPDGRFMAFKGLHRTESTTMFRSTYDPNFEYELQVKTRQPRELCNLDPDCECGPGLHAGHFDYAKGYGNTFCEVIIDPIDVIRCPGGHGEKLVTCALVLFKVQPHDAVKPVITYWDRSGPADKLPADPENVRNTGVGDEDDNDGDEGHDEPEAGTNTPIGGVGEQGTEGAVIKQVDVATDTDRTGGLPVGLRTSQDADPKPPAPQPVAATKTAGKAQDRRQDGPGASASKKRVRGAGRTYYRLGNGNRSIESKRFDAHPGKPWTSHRDALEDKLVKSPKK